MYAIQVVGGELGTTTHRNQIALQRTSRTVIPTRIDTASLTAAAIEKHATSFDTAKCTRVSWKRYYGRTRTARVGVCSIDGRAAHAHTPARPITQRPPASDGSSVTISLSLSDPGPTRITSDNRKASV